MYDDDDEDDDDDDADDNIQWKNYILFYLLMYVVFVCKGQIECVLYVCLANK